MHPEVYLYGTIVDSTILRLAGAFPQLDTYGELAQSWNVVGGEAFNGAVALSRLGVRTKVAGPFCGTKSRPLIRHYAEKYDIDVSELENDESWEGLRDWVLVDDGTRTVLGRFGAYFSDPVRRWSRPNAESIRRARVVCIDPWFPETSEEAARLCVEAKIPYVTIDCKPDSYLALHSAVNVVSGEYRQQNFSGVDVHSLLSEYAERSNGLVVFSSGSKSTLFRRQNSKEQSQEAFPVSVVSTLGAGDVFRAALTYGLLKSFEDAAAVRFASAYAALACTQMPIAETAPSLEQVRSFLADSPSVH